MTKMNQGGNAAVAEIHDSNSFENLALKTDRPLAMGSGSLTVAGQTKDFDYEIGAPVNGRSRIETRSSTGNDLSPEHGRLTKIGIACVAAWMAVSSTARHAAGNIIPAGASDTPYLQMGSAQQGLVLSLQATLPNGTTEHVSATYLDPWDVATAAHCLVGVTGSISASTIRIGTSSNFNNPNAGVVVSASNYVVIPGYTPGSTAATTRDLAIIHLSSPLPEMNQLISSLSPAVGAVLTFGGFGISGQADGGSFSQDGNSRGWLASVDEDIGDSDYMIGEFGTIFGTPTNGNGFTNDSGGRVGHVIGGINYVDGIMVAQFGSTGQSGGTEFLNFAQPDVHEFILNNLSTPEPTTFGVLVVGLGAAILPRRKKV